MIGRRDFFFCARCTLFILTDLFLPSSSVSLSYFIICCSHARVFWKTLVHEFQISNSHTEWDLIFSRGETVLALAEASRLKSNHTTTRSMIVYLVV